VDAAPSYTLQFFKYPDALHWRHEGHWLGEDEFGAWIGCRKGDVAQRGIEPARRISGHQVHLVPRDDWWVLTYAPYHPKATHWIDISTPATFEEGRVTTIDLDLDVVRTPEGLVLIDDEDEFAEHQVSLGYPPELIENAERATSEMYEALAEMREPMDAVARGWLDRVG
jgi:predicted RNA-binding protein associated with RNAse of E/G family